MIIATPMTDLHFELLRPLPSFAGFKARMDPVALLEDGRALAWVQMDTGEVLALGGYIERLPGVSWMWFLPGENGAQIMGRVTRHFQNWIETLPWGVRVEATVLASFPEGNRWAAMLGLKRETGEPMIKWDGQDDYHQYARVSGERDDDA